MTTVANIPSNNKHDGLPIDDVERGCDTGAGTGTGTGTVGTTIEPNSNDKIQEVGVNEQTPLLPVHTIQNDADKTGAAAAAAAADTETNVTNAEATTASTKEAIPASSVQQTAMSGFAGLGCTYGIPRTQHAK
jgi:hypothetical protein